MRSAITITDTTVRDGQQSLWATRMSTAMMIGVAEQLEQSGVDCVDVISHAGFDSAVRFLNESPYERIRTLRQLMPTPDIAGSASGKTAWGFRVAPEDILNLHLELTIKNGVNRLRAMNGLLDLTTIVDTLRQAKALGAKTIGAFVYSISPVHTDELYERKTRELVQLADVDYIMIKDSGGLLTPERAGPLIEAIRRGAAGRKLTLHSHCMTGMAPRVYMIGAEHGIDDLQCAIWPLALGNSQPSMQTTVRNLLEEGYEVGVDLAPIEAASDHLLRVAKRHGFPLGRASEYDHYHYSHQVPGGMLSNLRSQLAANGLSDRFREILEEAVHVREELGWPTMVTPFSQFVGAQALLNVVSGERYSTIPDEIRHYALGHYGELLAPIEPHVLDKILADVPQDISRPPETLPPALPGLRKRYPHADDEELFLRYMIPEGAVEETLKARERTHSGWRDAGFRASNEPSALVGLLAKAATLTSGGQIEIRKGDLAIRVRS